MISSTVAAVVVTYNRINLLKRTIASLNTQQHALSSIIVIIVIILLLLNY